jgi:hypothetical protein
MGALTLHFSTGESSALERMLQRNRTAHSISARVAPLAARVLSTPDSGAPGRWGAGADLDLGQRWGDRSWVSILPPW